MVGEAVARTIVGRLLLLVLNLYARLSDYVIENLVSFLRIGSFPEIRCYLAGQELEIVVMD